jgi:hypothetical protein
MKKSKFRLNRIDILIVILMVGLIAGTIVKFQISTLTSLRENQTPITYQVRVTGVRDLTVNAIREGDTLYEADTDRELGVIQSIEVSDNLSLIQDPEAQLHWVETDDRYNMILTVEGTGTVENNTYTINRLFSLTIGSAHQFYTKYSTWTGTIWAIER